MPEPADPLSRHERQQQTRTALVHAARAVFADVGYHAANLETIARSAGYSKGAVYSNFDGKAELFLHVIDLNIASSYDVDGMNVFEPLPNDWADRESADELAAAIRGFALATLEFIGVAAREPALHEALGRRISALIDAYAATARQSGAANESLDDRRLGALLAALDQGVGILALSGDTTIDQRLLRTGMRRILDPERANEIDADKPIGTGAGAGDAAFLDPVIQRNLARSIDDLRAPGAPGPEAGDDAG